MDGFNGRSHEDETLTPNSVILQDMPAYVLDSAGGHNPKQILVSVWSKEDNNRLDPDTHATIPVLLPIASNKFGICLNTDTIFGFLIVGRVNPSPPQ